MLRVSYVYSLFGSFPHFTDALPLPRTPFSQRLTMKAAKTMALMTMRRMTTTMKMMMKTIWKKMMGSLGSM